MLPVLALEHGVPVVPVYLSGLKTMRPKGQREITPGPVGVELLAPVRFAPGTSVAVATRTLWERMNERHVCHTPAPPLRHVA